VPFRSEEKKVGGGKRNIFNFVYTIPSKKGNKTSENM
jgi:hypothetical protein